MSISTKRLNGMPFSPFLPETEAGGGEPFAVHPLSSHGLTSGGFFAAIGTFTPTLRALLVKPLFPLTRLKNHQKRWANLIRPQLSVAKQRSVNMKTTLFAVLAAALGITSAALADRTWPREAYLNVIERVNTNHPGARRDPQESDPSLKATFQTAEARAIRGLQNAPPDNPDFILLFWRVKTSILFKEFGIRWRSPAVLNPKTDFTKQ